MGLGVNLNGVLKTPLAGDWELADLGLVGIVYWVVHP